MERRCHVGFVEESPGVVLQAEPALFRHYVPFRIELPEYGVLHPVGFQNEPEFGPVRGKFDKVGGGLGRGGRVQVPGPVLVQDLVEFVGSDVLGRFPFQGPDSLPERREDSGIGGEAVLSPRGSNQCSRSISARSGASAS